MSNTKAFTRLTTATAPYYDGEKEIRERVIFAAEVIRNTLHKFPYSDWPSKLKWAASSPAPAVFTGFTFKSSSEKASWVPRPITAENPVTEQHVVNFYVIKRQFLAQGSPLLMEEVSLPANLLFKDPMAVAQYARKLIRAQQAGGQKEAAEQATRRLAELNRKLAEADRTRQNLEKEREKVTARREEYLAAAKNFATQQETRRQEKAARRQARQAEANK